MHPSEERLDARVADALRALDRPPPAVRPEAVIASARRLRAGRRLVLRAAAVLGLIAVAGVALAMPGSPIRRWLGRASAGAASRAMPSPAAPAPGSATPRAARPLGARIALTPGDSFELVVEQLPSGGEVLIATALPLEMELSVRATRGSASYAVLPAGVLVRTSDDTAAFEVAVPERVRRFRVRWGDRVVFERRDGVVRTSGSQNSTGAYVLPFGHKR